MKVQTKAQRAAALLIVAVIIGVAGCAWTPAQRVVDVTIHDDGGKFRFEPAEISVRRGDVVRFTVGKAAMPHNVEFIRNSSPDGADLGKTWSGPYLQKPGDSDFNALALDVLRIEEGEIADITSFTSVVFPALGLPPKL